MELRSWHKAEVVFRQGKLCHLLELNGVQQGYGLENGGNSKTSCLNTWDFESLLPLRRTLLILPRAEARSLGGTSSKVVNDKLNSSSWELGSERRKKSCSF